MSYLFSGGQLDRLAFGKNWGFFLVWGILLVLLGAFAITATTVTTLISVVFLGFVILISGLVVIIDSFTFWWRKGSGFFFHIIIGLLYFIVGVMLVKSPLEGSISITLILGILYTVVGIFRLISSVSLRSPRWGWSFFNGIISLLLGILILSSWPASSLFIIGLFVGIDLLFTGWTYIMASIAARSLMNNVR